MADVVHQMYGFLGESYMAVDEGPQIFIPETVNYKENVVQSSIGQCGKNAQVNIFRYKSDIATDSNADRVAFMKEFIIGKKIKDIFKLTDSYAIGIEFGLYNKEGKLIKSSRVEAGAAHSTAVIVDPIKSGDKLEYHKAFVFDGQIEILVPEVCTYGIRNGISQYPYTLKINKIFVTSTIGEHRYLDCNCEVDGNGNGCVHDYSNAVTTHAYNAGYNCHHHDALCHNNFHSSFITNGAVGTTMIDSVVASAILEEPLDYEVYTMAEVDVSCDNSYRFTFNQQLNAIFVNLEFFIDNYNEVYDKEDIDDLLKINNASDNEGDDTTGSSSDPEIIVDDGE